VNQAPGTLLSDPLSGPSPERVARVFILVAIGTVSMAIFALMRPDQIFLANTPTGGDMGAHVLLPATLRDSVLPSGRLLGWSGDWYAGFPVLYFYFPLPAFAIVLLDVFLPYGVAFKLVTVAGLVAMPPAAYYFARSMGFDRAVAVVGGVAGGFFVLMENYSILGGNTLSTLAGEYSYSWSMALSLFYLGLLTRNTRKGRGFTVGAAVLLALTALSHVVTASVAVVASVALLYRRKGVEAVFGSWVLGFLFAAWWAVPVVVRKLGGLMTSMKWWPRQDWKHWLWPDFGGYCETACPARDLAPLLLLAVGGIVWAAARRKAIGPAILMMAFPVIVFYVFAGVPFASIMYRDTLNSRWLPYFYFGVFLFAGLFVGMLLAAIARRLRQVTPGRVFAALVALLAAGEGAAIIINLHLSGSISDRLYVMALVAVLCGLGAAPALLAFVVERPVPPDMYVAIGSMSLGSLVVWLVGAVPFYSGRGASILQLGGIAAGSAALLALVMLVALWRPAPRTVWVTAGAGVLLFMNLSLFSVHKTPGWAGWNYSGYEGKGSYPEYQALMEALDDEPPGRVMWEANSDLGRYGTPMALMLTGYWSEGHPSMEGLLFESSLTTEFHFLNASEMSLRPSNPIPDLKYPGFNLDRGVVHMALYDVAYYVTFTEEATRAAVGAGLEVLAEPDPFTLYALPEASLVDVASYLPAVWDGEEGFRKAALDWYDNVDALDYWMAADGPADWPRITEVGPDDRQIPYDGVGVVSDIQLDHYSISFHTDAVGVPHLVKVSYFPNWQAEGAEGPYYAAPSLMIVVPTEEDVSITFGRDWDDNLGLLFTGSALLGLAVWALNRRRRRWRDDDGRLALLPESPADAG